jgi:hypothetical protein
MLAALAALSPVGATAHASIPDAAAPRVRMVPRPLGSWDVDIRDGNSWDGASYSGGDSGAFLPHGVSWD